MTTIVFTGLVGQETAIERMRRSATQPGHAYMLVGPKGADLVAAAREFAAALITTGASSDDGADERTVDLVRRGSHPDVPEFEPEGTNLSIRQVREQIVPEAWHSPIEAPRKVLIIFEAEALCRGGMESANALLKTFEEPPPTTVILLVTSSPDELIPTVRSRCQRIDLAPLDEATVVGALMTEGHDEASAKLAARLAGGQLGRARALATDRRALRAAFLGVLDDIDGTGSGVASAAETLDIAVKEAIATVKERNREELEGFDAAAERAGYPQRAIATQRRRMTTRHERHERMARREALIEGVTVLETVYRDALAGPDAPRRNLDREPPKIEPRACARALEACRQARQALEFNPNEGLLLERLLFHLPGATGRGR